MNLLSKYNVQVPRYTSYPTVPAWSKTPTEGEWLTEVRKSFKKTNAENGISLYIHLPYCESLCTYCACNTRITVNHKVERPYIDAVLAEWKIYLSHFDEKPKIKELHLGGGTPTFFSPQNLQFLITEIFKDAIVPEEHDYSFEGHPSNTTEAHLQTLFDLGFKRVSFGIQDFDEKVQDTINRYQTFEEVDAVVKSARTIGYESINFDLVYGLPFQTEKSLRETLSAVILLKPDRIAFYSYAHVPWLKPGQRKFTEKDLPLDVVKRNLYELGLQIFSESGFQDIGMDHFSLITDSLYSASINESMHRNFMGYTDKYTELLLALGASSISDCKTAFIQNIKTVEEYQQMVLSGHLPITKGHLLSEEDLFIRQIILDIMCKGHAHWPFQVEEQASFKKSLQQCLALQDDGLLTLRKGGLIVTPIGKSFLRNICACFDVYLNGQIQKTQIFSTVA